MLFTGWLFRSDASERVTSEEASAERTARAAAEQELARLKAAFFVAKQQVSGMCTGLLRGSWGETHNVGCERELNHAFVVARLLSEMHSKIPLGKIAPEKRNRVPPTRSRWDVGCQREG